MESWVYKVPVLANEVMLQLSTFQHDRCPFAHLEAGICVKHWLPLLNSVINRN